MKKLNFSSILLILIITNCSKNNYFSYRDFACIKIKKNQVLFYPVKNAISNIYSVANYFKLKDTLFFYTIDTCKCYKLSYNHRVSSDSISIIIKSKKIIDRINIHFTDDLNEPIIIAKTNLIVKKGNLFLEKSISSRLFKIPKSFNEIEVVNNCIVESDNLIPFNDTAKYLIRNDSLILLTKHNETFFFVDYYVICKKNNCANLKFLTKYGPYQTGPPWRKLE